MARPAHTRTDVCIMNELSLSLLFLGADSPYSHDAKILKRTLRSFMNSLHCKEYGRDHSRPLNIFVQRSGAASHATSGAGTAGTRVLSESRLGWPRPRKMPKKAKNLARLARLASSEVRLGQLVRLSCNFMWRFFAHYSTRIPRKSHAVIGRSVTLLHAP